MKIFVVNCFAEVESRLTARMPGPDAFEYLIAEFAHQFSAIDSAQVSGTARAVSRRGRRAFQEWLPAIKLVVGGSMNMGSFSPGLPVVLGSLRACLSSQYPAIVLFFWAKL